MKIINNANNVIRWRAYSAAAGNRALAREGEVAPTSTTSYDPAGPVLLVFSRDDAPHEGVLAACDVDENQKNQNVTLDKTSTYTATVTQS